MRSPDDPHHVTCAEPLSICRHQSKSAGLFDVVGDADGFSVMWVGRQGLEP
jgi:hypothetical protein